MQRIEIDVQTGQQTVVDVPQAEADAIQAAYDATAVTNLKSIGFKIIDDKAEEMRKKYLTSAPLQGATYLSKEADAKAYKTAGYPTPFDEYTYQYVWAEMAANGDATAQIAADRIIAEAEAYNTGTALVKGKGPLIEKERRAAKIAINAAATVTDVNTAISAGISALDAL